MGGEAEKERECRSPIPDHGCEVQERQSPSLWQKVRMITSYRRLGCNTGELSEQTMLYVSRAGGIDTRVHMSKNDQTSLFLLGLSIPHFLKPLQKKKKEPEASPLGGSIGFQCGVE